MAAATDAVVVRVRRSWQGSSSHDELLITFVMITSDVACLSFGFVLLISADFNFWCMAGRATCATFDLLRRDL